jgi:hypothetical protein
MNASRNEDKPPTRSAWKCAVAAIILGAALPQLVHADTASAGMEAYRRGDYAVALEKLSPVAAHGNGPACVIVGRIYLDGRGVPTDAGLAARYFEIGAGQGDRLAASYLGDLYFSGDGVAKNAGQAIRYWKLAGHLGEPRAAHNLGIEFRDGVDVTVDRRLALRWLEAAVEGLQGSTEHLRERFVADRDALRAQLSADDLAAAAALVTSDGPTPIVVFRDSKLLIERAMQHFTYGRRSLNAGAPAVVVMLVLVQPNGHIADSVVENRSDQKGFENEVLRLVQASSIVPTRVEDRPVESWQVIRWSLDQGY